MHVVGIEEVMDEEQQPDEQDDLQRQKAISAKLVERIQELEEDVQHLEARIRQLEQEHMVALECRKSTLCHPKKWLC